MCVRYTAKGNLRHDSLVGVCIRCKRKANHRLESVLRGGVFAAGAKQPILQPNCARLFRPKRKRGSEAQPSLTLRACILENVCNPSENRSKCNEMQRNATKCNACSLHNTAWKYQA